MGEERLTGLAMIRHSPRHSRRCQSHYWSLRL